MIDTIRMQSDSVVLPVIHQCHCDLILWEGRRCLVCTTCCIDAGLLSLSPGVSGHQETLMEHAAIASSLGSHLWLREKPDSSCPTTFYEACLPQGRTYMRSPCSMAEQHFANNYTNTVL